MQLLIECISLMLNTVFVVFCGHCTCVVFGQSSDRFLTYSVVTMNQCMFWYECFDL